MLYNSTLDYLQFVKYARHVLNKNKIQKISKEKQLITLRKKHPHHLIVGAFKVMHSRQLYTEFEKAASRFNTLKFVDLTDLDYFERTFLKTNKESFDSINGSVVIIRKDEFVRRQIKQFEMYDHKKYDTLDYFIKANYLIDIDLFTPWNFQHHLIFGKPVVFLGFDDYIDMEKDQERLNFMQLRIQKRLVDPYSEKFQFSIVELPYFQELRDELNLIPNELGVHFFVKDFVTGKSYVLDKSFMIDH